MPNFMDILDKRVGDIERPPLLPHGTYKWVVDKYSTDTIANGAWEVVDFNLKIVEPTEDVDPDDLTAFGNVAGQTRRHRFMFPTDPEEAANFQRTEFNLRRFLADHLQIDGVEGMDLKEALANAKGHMCLATVVWTPDKKDPSGENKFDNIGRTAPVE